MKAHVLINPAAGAVAAFGIKETHDLIVEQLEAAGSDVEVVEGSALDLSESCRERIKARSADLVVTAGGDGTVAAIAGVLAGTNVPLLPLPGGTMNMLSNDLDIPLDFREALQRCLAATPRSIDLGFIGDRAFVNNIVFGAYADLAEARETLRSAANVDDAIAAISQAARAAASASPQEYRIHADDLDVASRTNTVLISNNPYTGARGLQPVRARLDSGKLSIYLPKSVSAADLVARLLETLAGRLDASETVSVIQLVHCTVETDKLPMHVSIDGDPVELDEVAAIRIEARAVQVLAPSERSPA